MLNSKKYILLSLLSISITVSAFSQIPNLSEVEVLSEVEFDNSAELYTYSYTILNGENSTEAIFRFALDISRDSESVELDTDNLHYANEFIEVTYKNEFSNSKGEVIPIGIPTLPQYWLGLLDSRIQTIVFSGDVRNDIKPGESQDSIIITSKGLPGIREFNAEPYINVDEFYPSEFEVNNLDSLIQVIEKDRRVASYSGQTVGPIAPPAIFVSLDFLETLIVYKTQSCDLGWIENQGICRSLQANLDNVKRQLEQGNTQTAANNLLAFLNEVETIKDQHLSSEAYALLKYNGEYLLDKLRDK
ncbi:MAG: hypothetical protein WEB89_03820 [Balneolales bacterium]